MLRTDHGPTGRLTCSSQLGVERLLSFRQTRSHTITDIEEEKKKTNYCLRFVAKTSCFSGD